jgi:nucleotide-binding universal stress UspA family protein
MFQHILVATDGSEYAERAVAHALALAKSLNAKVTAVTVTDMIPAGPYAPIPWPSDIERYEASAATSARKILEGVIETARSLGVTCVSHHIADQAPAEGILGAAAKEGCDLIVMGSYSRDGLAGLILGSQVNKVITLGRIPVLVCR